MMLLTVWTICDAAYLNVHIVKRFAAQTCFYLRKNIPELFLRIVFAIISCMQMPKINTRKHHFYFLRKLDGLLQIAPLRLLASCFRTNPQLNTLVFKLFYNFFNTFYNQLVHLLF